MTYDCVVQKDIIAYTKDNEIYLPMLEILDKLKIYYEYDYLHKKIVGYINSPDHSYNYDFEKSNGKSVRDTLIKTGRVYFIDNAEIYTTKDFFKRLLLINIEIDILTLQAVIKSDTCLPVLQEARRSISYKKAGNEESDYYFPLKFDKEFSVLDGGMVSYIINQSASPYIKRYSLYSCLALEVLGGEFNLNSFSYATENNPSVYNWNSFRWRMNFNSLPYLTYITIGNQLNSGSKSINQRSYVFKGINITNEMERKTSFFSNWIYTGQLAPGWDVEIYKNGRMYSHIITDSSGYSFRIPMNYGLNNIEIKSYGSRGEFKLKKESLLITGDFLPAGDLKYSLNLGILERDNRIYADGIINSGITNWLTNSLRIGYNESSKHTDIYNSVYFRTFSNLITSIDYSPSYLYSINLNYQSTLLGSYEFYFTDFNSESKKARTNTKNLLGFSILLPKMLNLPMNVNCRLQRYAYTGSSITNLMADINFNLKRMNITANYNASLRQVESGSKQNFFTNQLYVALNYNWFNTTKVLPFIKYNSILLGALFDINNNKLLYTRASISQSLFGKLFLNYSLENSFSGVKQTRYSVGINYDLGFARFNSNMYSEARSFIYDNQVQGSISYQSRIRNVDMTSNGVLQVSGISGACIRLFEDSNSNEKYDIGETIIPNASVEIQNAAISYSNDKKTILANNLSPYTRYNLTINTGLLENPNLLPKWKELSFITDPNCYKQIDIPCYYTGIVEGSVTLNIGSNPVKKGGFKIHIKSTDSTYIETFPVFSDGSFFIMGLPAGEYRAYIDHTQQSILNVKSIPEFIEFKVLTKVEGDYIGNLNFILNQLEDDTQKNIK